MKGNDLPEEKTDAGIQLFFLPKGDRGVYLLFADTGVSEQDWDVWDDDPENRRAMSLSISGEVGRPVDIIVHAADRKVGSFPCTVAEVGVTHALPAGYRLVRLSAGPRVPPAASPKHDRHNAQQNRSLRAGGWQSRVFALLSAERDFGGGSQRAYPLFRR